MIVEEKPDSAEWVMARHNYVAGRYARWRTFIDEVLLVFKGEYEPMSDLDRQQARFNVERPSKPRSIVEKVTSLLGVNPDMRIEVLPLNGSKHELKRAEFAEQALRAWWWLIEDEHQTPLREDVANGFALFGRQPVIMHYEPGQLHFPIYLEVAEPRTCYTYFGRFGPTWYTREYLLPLAEAKDEFSGESIDWRKIAGGSGKKREAVNQRSEWDIPVRVVEYANARWRAYVVEGEKLTAPREHDFGFLPLVEPRLKRTALRDEERYASGSILGPALDELKGEADLASKISNLVELDTDPVLYYNTPEGIKFVRQSDARAGEVEPVPPGVELKQLVVQPNTGPLDWLRAYYASNASKSTISELLWAQDLPADASGFMVQSVLSVVRDQVNAWVHELERAYSRINGMALQLMREKADAQAVLPTDPTEDFTPGFFRLPGFTHEEERRRRGQEWLEVGRDDISQHHRVRVTLRPDLPRDTVSQATIGAQMAGTVTADGLPLYSRQTIQRTVNLVDNLSEEESHIQSDMLALKDPRVQAEESRSAYVRYMLDTQHQRRDTDRLEKRINAEQERRMVKIDLADEASPVHIPPERKYDSQLLIEMAMLAAEGIDPNTALAQESNPNLTDPAMLQMSEAGLVPGQMGAAPPGFNPTQGPFTGMEGVPNTALPPAAQGAPDRRIADRPNLAAENIAERVRRGERPPPR